VRIINGIAGIKQNTLARLELGYNWERQRLSSL
jgi:hypothetical protein